MGNSAIYGHLCPNADSAYHESYLVDQAVGQNSPEVVFNDRIEDRECRHNRSDPDKGLGTRKAPGQGVNSTLCSKSAQEYGPGNCSLRIGVGQPWMEKRPGAIQAKTQEN